MVRTDFFWTAFVLLLRPWLCNTTKPFKFIVLETLMMDVSPLFMFFMRAVCTHLCHIHSVLFVHRSVFVDF